MGLDEHPDAIRWNARYATAGVASVAAVLQQHQQHLPAQGSALDLACGRGGNALFLAERGLTVHAWDIARLAITQLEADAAARGLFVHTAVRDVVAEPPPADQFDVIIVSHFLERSLFPLLCGALRQGGLLYYQGFGPLTAGSSGPRNPAYRLGRGELLEQVPLLQTLYYQEENGEIGYLGRK